MSLKHLIALCLIVLLCPLASAVGQQPTGANPNMTKEEREMVLKLLREARQETLDAIKNVSEAQWTFKPAPEKWSVGEVAEHIFMAEGALFSRVEEALAAPLNPEWEAKTKGKTEFLLDVMAPRKGRAQAPESIVPTGKMTKTEFLKKYEEARAGTMKFAQATDKPLKGHTAEHPFKVFNTLNAYQWLIYIPLHNQRHNKQIAEVMANPVYPK
ncbi:MAG: DinB family protein [Blastocatellia bacterium]